MEMERSHTTERILNLTLEIIYLLTGENYIAFKLSDALVTSNLTKTQISVKEPPSRSLNKDNKKIQEFTREIIELLAVEVPIRCQAGTAYFSLEDWENLEGHKDLYKDIMIENQLPLPSPEGSTNTPQRCPRPVDSRDSMEEPQEIPQERLENRKEPHEIHEDQENNHILSGTKPREKAKEPLVRGDDLFKEEELPPEVSPDHEDTRDTQRYVEAEEQANHVRIKEEDISPEISTSGQYMSYNPDPHSYVYPDCEIEEEEEDILSRSTRENPMAPGLHPAPFSAELSSGPSSQGRWFPDDFHPVGLHEDPGCPKSLPCSDCGKCFNERSKLATHRRSHTGEKPFSCMECGKSFKQSSHLVSHHRTHTRVHPYSCSECGKCFSQKSNLIRHEKVHTGEKSFSCLECGKRFSEKSNLIRHEKIHTGEKPYSCSECGRCFSLRANLIAHVRTHTGEKPFACSVCGKCFSRKSVLIIHERVHTGEKPYSCSDCGKCFSKRFLYARHARLHAGENSFSRPSADSSPKEPMASFTRGLTEVINRFCYQAVDSFHVSPPLSYAPLPAGDRRFQQRDVVGE